MFVTRNTDIEQPPGLDRSCALWNVESGSSTLDLSFGCKYRVSQTCIVQVS